LQPNSEKRVSVREAPSFQNIISTLNH